MENCLKEAFFTQFWPHKKIDNWYFAHILPTEGWNCQKYVETKKTKVTAHIKKIWNNKGNEKCPQKSFCIQKLVTAHMKKIWRNRATTSVYIWESFLEGPWDTCPHCPLDNPDLVLFYNYVCLHRSVFSFYSILFYSRNWFQNQTMSNHATINNAQMCLPIERSDN